MKIAYIANYQGPSLVERRPCLYNLSLAARVKIQLIAELLVRSSHEVDILSQGALEPRMGEGRQRSRYYPSLVEAGLFHPDIAVYYAPAISIRYLTGFWESLQCSRLLSARHRHRPYDAVIIYNMQRGQIGCARHASRQLGIPVLLQYEDDVFVDIHGRASEGILSRYHQRSYRKVLESVSGAMAVSPYLLSQLPQDTPKVLLRGVVSEEILKTRQTCEEKKKRVVFSGTHEGTQGLQQLIAAWRMLKTEEWELHIAGQGPLTPKLKQMAGDCRSIVFHGLLDRLENARLLCSARIGVNPQDVTKTPGNVFAFKLIEYLAAGTHVITTPRGSLEPELERGVSYIHDNSPEMIATCLQEVISEGRMERTAADAAVRTYGPDAVSATLNGLLEQATSRFAASVGEGRAVRVRSSRRSSEPRLSNDL